MIYVTSDIHAEYDLFRSLLDKIGFSLNDEMYVCGDMIEKGNDSIKLLRFIMNHKNIHCIIGNHEYDFLKCYWSLMEQNTDYDLVLDKLKAYFPHDGYLLDWDVVDYLESLPYYIEKEHFICVHAGIPTDRKTGEYDLKQTSVNQLVYDRLFKEPNRPLSTDKCIFFGHTPTRYISDEDEILTYDNTKYSNVNGVKKFAKVHLDLGTYLCGKLGCFCVDSCKIFYVAKS